MSTLTIRNIEPAIKDKLRLSAASHGRSMEEEVRSILREVLARSAATPRLGSRVHERFASLGGEALALPVREQKPRSANFGAATATRTVNKKKRGQHDRA